MHELQVAHTYKKQKSEDIDTSSDFLFPSAIKDLTLLFRAVRSGRDSNSRPPA